MNVHWTEAALADLRAVETYLARHSARYAHGLIERIFACSERLGPHTRLGPVVPEYEDEAIREVFEAPYRIVYRVCGDRIDIVAVVHSARRLPRGL